MGKVVIYTGSRLLGEELRRLRGVRSLEDISNLTKSDPLRRRIRPLSLATLSQVENAKAMPNLESLHSLAVVYQVSAQHLLNIMVEERLCKTMELPESQEAVHAEFARARKEGRWYDALTLAIHGERLAVSEHSVAAWRANRGICLIQVGLRGEGVDLLSECVEIAGQGREQQIFERFALVEGLLEIGRINAATLYASQLPALLDGGDKRLQLKFALLQAHLELETYESGHDVQERRLRSAQRHFEQAKQLTDAKDVFERVRAEIGVADCHRLLGNHLVAARDLSLLMEEARRSGYVQHEAEIGLSLGLCLLEGATPTVGRKQLEETASLAFRNGLNDIAFAAYATLFRVSKAAGAPEASHWCKRGRRLLPMVDRHRRIVQEFEKLSKEFLS